MRSKTATTGRVRLVIVLAVAAAVTVMFGAILVAASMVMRLLTRNDPTNMVRLGLDAVAAGVAFGLVVLVIFAVARIGTAGRSRPPMATAEHRRGNPGPQPAPASDGKSPGRGMSQEQRQDRFRAGAPGPGSGHGSRSGRPSVLSPTNVYSPGGLLDVPRDGRGPGTPGGQAVPEILRNAGPPPPAPPGRAGAQPPRPGYQPGMNQGPAGRPPYAPGGQPPPAPPPRDHMRPREAPRPGPAMPPREAVPPRDGMPPREAVPPRDGMPHRDGMHVREPMPPRGASSSGHPQASREVPRPPRPGPPREAGLPRDGMPREAMGSGGPIRPGAPLPPRDPGYQPPPGQHQHQPPPGQHQPPRGGAGRHAAGPGYAARDGRRPGVPGSAGPAGPAEAAEQFDGGYAYVIRPSDNPVRPPSPARPPGFARPADPVRPADPEVYVYRDTDGQPGDPRAAVAGPDEHDAAYWYDLPGTGGREDTTPRVSQETRGPFEPLVSSADPPGTTPRSADRPADAEPAVSQEYTQARKLEQIKDLYLTAEAIGEANVDKHFDHLLVQQRELISDYFKQSNAARPEADGAGQAGAEDTQLTADQPRVW